MPGLSEAKHGAIALVGRECTPDQIRTINIEADTVEEILEKARAYTEYTGQHLCSITVYSLEHSYMEQLYRGAMSVSAIISQIDSLAKTIKNREKGGGQR